MTVSGSIAENKEATQACRVCERSLESSAVVIQRKCYEARRFVSIERRSIGARTTARAKIYDILLSSGQDEEVQR